MGDIPQSQKPQLPVSEPLDFTCLADPTLSEKLAMNDANFSEAFNYSFLYDGSLQLPVVKSAMEGEPAPVPPVPDHAFAPIMYSGDVPDKWLFPTRVSNESLFAGIQRPTKLFTAPNEPLMKPQRHPFRFPKPGDQFENYLQAFRSQKVNTGHFINANSTGWPNLPHNLNSFLKPRFNVTKTKAVPTRKWRSSSAYVMPIEKAYNILQFVRDLKPGQVVSSSKKEPEAERVVSGSGHHISRNFYEKKHPEKYAQLLMMPILVRTMKMKSFFQHIELSVNSVRHLIGTTYPKFGTHKDINRFLEGDCVNINEELSSRVTNLYLNLRFSPEFVTKFWAFKQVKQILHKKFIDGKVAMWEGCPNLDKLETNCKCTAKPYLNKLLTAATESQTSSRGEPSMRLGK